jgi:hypothetical protein
MRKLHLVPFHTLTEKPAGTILRWWEFICAGCGDSEFFGAGQAQCSAIQQARRVGWRLMTSPAGRLWMCPDCTKEAK